MLAVQHQSIRFRETGQHGVMAFKVRSASTASFSHNVNRMSVAFLRPNHFFYDVSVRATLSFNFLQKIFANYIYITANATWLTVYLGR